MTALDRKRKASIASSQTCAKFQCSMRLGTGRRYSRLFTRYYNRVRHERELYSDPFTIFQYNPGGAWVALSDPRPDAAVDFQASQDQHSNQPSASASPSASPSASSSASPLDRPLAGPSTSAFTPANPAPAEQHSQLPGLGLPAIDSSPPLQVNSTALQPLSSFHFTIISEVGRVKILVQPRIEDFNLKFVTFLARSIPSREIVQAKIP